MIGDFFFNALAFVVALGVLIAFHEFGHYWVARKLGVKVLRFSIGFGKPLLHWVRGADQTEYVIAAIPLGGYVKMLDEREGEVKVYERHRAFNNQSLATRSAIVVAGPVFNFILAVVAYWGTFVIGIADIKPVLGTIEPTSVAGQAGFKKLDEIVSVNGETTSGWSRFRITVLDKSLNADTPLEIEVIDGNQQQTIRQLDLTGMALFKDEGDAFDKLGFKVNLPTIPAEFSEVVPDSPAALAGLQVGDRILAMDNQRITNWSEMTRYVVDRANQEVSLLVRRDQQQLELLITPRPHPQDKSKGYIGVKNVSVDASHMRTEIQFGPLAALGEAMDRTWTVTLMTVKVLGKLISLQASWTNISGPITIAKYAGLSASYGAAEFLSFLAIISVSLGVLNLLPIPVLDGGHLLYFFVEAVTRKPVSESVLLVGQQIGIGLLMGLMGLAFYNDILRLMG